jgi:4-hydroxyphenylacetate 3-monooxygenase
MPLSNRGNGARRGVQVLERLRENPPNLWYDGRLVEDPTTYAAMRRGVETLAALYDTQWTQPEIALYDSPSSGAKVSRTFLIPRTADELTSISRAMKARADWSFGMLGRAPDYLNRALTGYASGQAFLGEADARFGENALRYYEYLRENDLSMTHTLITPQANRAVGTARQADPFLAARVKEETSAGLVIHGCRMLATLPFADELMVFPSTLLKNQEEDAPYAFGFCLPTHTPGLKFLCRESLDYGRSRYDHPLGSRFEELDSVVIFDNVFVPWERVLLYRDVARCNAAYARTGALACMTHQVVVKDLAKTEYLMGLASLMAHTIGIETFQHIHEKLAEIWVNMETMRAFLRAAEADAALDEYGMLRPAWDPLDAARTSIHGSIRGWLRSSSKWVPAVWLRCRAKPTSAVPWPEKSSAISRPRGPRRTSAFRCSSWRGTLLYRHSHRGRYCMSASSSAIRCGWPGRWCRTTIALRTWIACASF